MPGGQPGYGYPPPGYPQPGYPQPGYPQPYDEDPTAVVGTRVGQYLLDAILVVVPVIALMIGLFAVSATNDTLGGLGFLLLMVVAYGLSWGVGAWWPATHGGQTPAMGWLDLRIVTAQGGVPGLGALSVRWLLLLVDGAFGGLVGFVIMMSTSRHQRLGDIAASTYVVRVG
ncbi:MAG TPA: RDD family protein [Pseudonocardia sp.]|jgi:uncharacterized RDD family membrane protein YckC|nr:RDD family protein [Pseudonocardia sp.]